MLKSGKPSDFEIRLLGDLVDLNRQPMPVGGRTRHSVRTARALERRRWVLFERAREIVVTPRGLAAWPALAARCAELRALGEPPLVDRSADVLTARQVETLASLSRGFTYADVGRLLNVTVNTVRDSVREIHRRLAVSSTVEAVLRAQALGLLVPPAREVQTEPRRADDSRCALPAARVATAEEGGAL